MPFRARIAPASIQRRRYAARTRLIISPSFFTPTSSPSFAPSSPSFRNAAPSFGPTRQKSTSTSFLGNFFTRPKPVWLAGTSRGASAGFIAAVKAEDIPALKTAYAKIIASINQDPPSSSSSSSSSVSPLSSEHLSVAMAFLSHSPSRLALALLFNMYIDNSALFGFETTKRHHQAMIRALCSAHQYREALSIAKMQDASEADYTSILAAAVKHGDNVRDVWEFIRKRRESTAQEYGILIEHWRLQVSRGSVEVVETHRERIRELMREMQVRGLELDEHGRAELVRFYIAVRNTKAAKEAAARLDKAGPSRETSTALLDLAMYKEDRLGVVQLCQAMTQAGLTLYEPAFTYLLASRIGNRSGSELIRHLDEVERETGSQATSSAWTFLVEHLLGQNRSDALNTALHVYNTARNRGIDVDARLARSLIIPLSTIRLRDAFDVYNDLISSEAMKTDAMKSRQVLSDIYYHLLSACSATSQYSAAIRLLNDMRSSNLDLAVDLYDYVGLITRLMRCGSDHKQAYQIYSLVHSLNPSVLDERAFEVIATSFLKLSWEQSPFVPASLFVEMMKDMHLAGYQPSARILTSLLRQYGNQATAIRKLQTDDEGESKRKMYHALMRAIEALHTRIKLDPLIEVDIPLLNALMDAYNRVGSFGSALGVWEELVDRRPHEPVETIQEAYARSIGTILDACGYVNQPQRARKIWAWARRHDLVPTQKLWDTYLECLCRTGQIGEALELLCVHMKSELAGAPSAGWESCEIVLKFSANDEKWFEEVQRRVKKEFPGWWLDLGRVLAGMRDVKGKLLE